MLYMESMALREVMLLLHSCCS